MEYTETKKKRGRPFGSKSNVQSKIDIFEKIKQYKKENKNSDSDNDMNVNFDLNDLNNTNFKIADDESEKSEQIENDDKPFLSNLNNLNFKIDVEDSDNSESKSECSIKQPKKRGPKPKKSKAVLKEEVNLGGEFDDLFDDKNPTQILGREKRQLISKINQYKSLFPEQLKKFKIKKNPSVQDLEDYLVEAESIDDTSSVENFMTE